MELNSLKVISFLLQWRSFGRERERKKKQNKQHKKTKANCQYRSRTKASMKLYLSLPHTWGYSWANCFTRQLAQLFPHVLNVDGKFAGRGGEHNIKHSLAPRCFWNNLNVLISFGPLPQGQPVWNVFYAPSAKTPLLFPARCCLKVWSASVSLPFFQAGIGIFHTPQ